MEDAKTYISFEAIYDKSSGKHYFLISKKQFFLIAEDEDNYILRDAVFGIVSEKAEDL